MIAGMEGLRNPLANVGLKFPPLPLQSSSDMDWANCATRYRAFLRTPKGVLVDAYVVVSDVCAEQSVIPMVEMQMRAQIAAHWKRLATLNSGSHNHFEKRARKFLRRMVAEYNP